MVKWWRWVADDFRAFYQRLQPPAPLAPGLYTYRLSPEGGRIRVHLRVADDRSGVLFIDVTDVIHLNATAAELAKWALDGVPVVEARRRMLTRFGGSANRDWQPDLDAIYAMVDRLHQPRLGCATCALTDIDRRPLFSVPVHAPFKADLAVTYQCNNDCPHCYNETDRLSLDMMPVDQWKIVIDRLCEVGVPHLIFTGGEATMHPGLLEMIHHADARGPICGLNTNGRRLSHVSYARDLAAAGLNHVQVTLGSHRADIHDQMMHARAFEQTVRGIENAQAAGLHAITNTTLMRMNANEFEQTIEFLHGLGIRTFAVNGMIYSGGGFATEQAISESQMAPILLRIRDKAHDLGMRFLWYTPTQYCRLSPVELEIGAKRCNAGEYSLCVEPNADVLPCQSYYVSAGNLLRDPWEEIWSGALFRSFRERELDPQGHGLPEKCWECPDLPLCGGGCRIEREAEMGVRSSTAGCGGCSGCGNAGFVGLELLRSPNRLRGTGQFEMPGFGERHSLLPIIGPVGRG